MQYRLHFSINWDNTLIIMPCCGLADSWLVSYRRRVLFSSIHCHFVYTANWASEEPWFDSRHV